jgi:plasmid stabilization system protein ParE
VVPELQDERIREVILGNFRIVYRFAPDQAQVLTVFHAARRFALPRGS